MEKSFPSGSWWLHSSPDLPHHHHALVSITQMGTLTLISLAASDKHNHAVENSRTWDTWVSAQCHVSKTWELGQVDPAEAASESWGAAMLGLCPSSVPTPGRAKQCWCQGEAIWNIFFLCSQDSSSCPEVLKAGVSGDCPTGIFTPSLIPMYFLLSSPVPYNFC